MATEVACTVFAVNRFSRYVNYRNIFFTKQTLFFNNAPQHNERTALFCAVLFYENKKDFFCKSKKHHTILSIYF